MGLNSIRLQLRVTFQENGDAWKLGHGVVNEFLQETVRTVSLGRRNLMGEENGDSCEISIKSSRNYP